MQNMFQKTLKITVAVLASLLAFSFSVRAQEKTGVEQTEVGTGSPQLDSSLFGKNIFSLLPSRSKGGRADVKVNQSQAISKALGSQISANSSRTMTGYRVRIFNDNKQTARGDSEAALNRFKGLYPGIPAYRTFTSPFFKVTVGDFRTKSEASRLLLKLKAAYPSAFVVKETINYPIEYNGAVSAAGIEE